MHLEKFAKELDINFKNTFDENSITQIINLVKENKTPINNLVLPDAFGVYIFFLKRELNFNTFQELETIWKEEGIDKFPKAIKKNFNECKSENSFYPFYIGKSEHLSTRVDEHLNHHKTHSTYGMKLNTRNNFKIEDFYIGHWCLENVPNISQEVKQFIITTIEQKVREKLKPLIGKK
ncbi:hypothetical protein FIA58_004600 [Flavobacterium jejuense]|uniref:GIY-YIG domain-containing protein n=1 Tax=Flavobacterium jejuense TaxID=1544455 RepID=A0ABX0IMY3_9FLAO|nr:hypothetical protein [Flavobacterium jejuense]NHN24951.1 hypothetical protein [Flavobacterium jejuense]